MAEKSVRAGISLASRRIHTKYSTSYQSASISPEDSTLQLQDLDRRAFILSTSIVVSPFLKAGWLQSLLKESSQMLKSSYNSVISRSQDKSISTADTINNKRKLFGLILKHGFLYALQNLGLTANLNLIEFSQAQKDLSFNKNLEGGIGVSMKLTRDLYFSYANEIVFSKQLRKFIKEKLEGRQLNYNGKVISSIDQIPVTNTDFYITENVIGHAFRLIFTF